MDFIGPEDVLHHLLFINYAVDVVALSSIIVGQSTQISEYFTEITM